MNRNQHDVRVRGSWTGAVVSWSLVVQREVAGNNIIIMADNTQTNKDQFYFCVISVWCISSQSYFSISYLWGTVIKCNVIEHTHRINMLALPVRPPPPPPSIHPLTHSWNQITWACSRWNPSVHDPQCASFLFYWMMVFVSTDYWAESRIWGSDNPNYAHRGRIIPPAPAARWWEEQRILPSSTPPPQI